MKLNDRQRAQIIANITDEDKVSIANMAAAMAVDPHYGIVIARNATTILKKRKRFAEKQRKREQK